VVKSEDVQESGEPEPTVNPEDGVEVNMETSVAVITSDDAGEQGEETPSVNGVTATPVVVQLDPKNMNVSVFFKI